MKPKLSGFLVPPGGARKSLCLQDAPRGPRPETPAQTEAHSLSSAATASRESSLHGSCSPKTPQKGERLQSLIDGDFSCNGCALIDGDPPNSSSDHAKQTQLVPNSVPRNTAPSSNSNYVGGDRTGEHITKKPSTRGGSTQNWRLKRSPGVPRRHQSAAYFKAPAFPGHPHCRGARFVGAPHTMSRGCQIRGTPRIWLLPTLCGFLGCSGGTLLSEPPTL